MRTPRQRSRAAAALALQALGVVGAAVPAVAVAQRAAPVAGAVADSIDAYAARAAHAWHVPGLAVAVVSGDSVVLAKGYGVRRLGASDAVDAHTRFAIGSTTKAMTAVALGMLVDEGKVRWDDPVITYLPGFRLADPYVTRAITVRDLLTHRAGLGNADLLWTDGGYSHDEIVRRVGTFKLAYPFRSGFVYQNIMFAVAGDVVAAASGMPWETFLRTRIWGPLGMHETEPTLAAVAGGADVATPHAEVHDTVRVVPNRAVDAVKAAGSVWSSVSDMARWMRFVLDSGRVNGRPLLKPATFREIFSPQTIAPAATYPATSLSRPHFFTYGFGWFLQDYRGEPVAMHTGSIDGMSAIIGLLPERRVGVYVLANLDHAELRHALMYRVFDAYLDAQGGGAGGAAGGAPRDWSAELLALFAREHAQEAAAVREAEAHRTMGTRPSLPLERYAGSYTDSTFGTVAVSASGGALHLTYGSKRAGDLEHWQYDTFRARWADPLDDPSTVVFQPDGAGGVASVRVFGVTFARVGATPRAE
ncbi:MAG TPA: serine hydrolase [Gemmatirosa sp.]